MRWSRQTLTTVGGTVATVVFVAVAMLVTTGHADVLDPGGSDGAATSSSNILYSSTRVESRSCLPAADLPPQARDTMRLIDDGGPFPYEQDGTVFGNYEGLLPDEPRGHYHEYTVITRGEDDRGARRIIAGSGGEEFYTADHYATFTPICVS